MSTRCAATNRMHHIRTTTSYASTGIVRGAFSYPFEKQANKAFLLFDLSHVLEQSVIVHVVRIEYACAYRQRRCMWYLPGRMGLSTSGRTVTLGYFVMLLSFAAGSK